MVTIERSRPASGSSDLSESVGLCASSHRAVNVTTGPLPATLRGPYGLNRSE